MVGYPDKWKTYDFDVKPADFLGNLMRAQAFEVFDPIVQLMNHYRADPIAMSERVFMSCGMYESLIYENRSLVPILAATGKDPIRTSGISIADVSTCVSNSPSGICRPGDPVAPALGKLRAGDAMLSVNVHGLLYVTRASLPHLIAAAADSPRGVADVVNISSTAGRVARPGTAVYSLTKFGIGAFSEGIRQEVLGQRVRVGLVEPGTVQTEITNNLPAADREAIEARSPGMVKLQPEDIADAVTYMVTRDRRVAVNEMLVRAAEQTW